MRHLLLFSYFVFLAFFDSIGQQRLNILESALNDAGSVIIVSHESTTGISLPDEQTGKRMPIPKLFKNGKLNYEIIHEKRNLSQPLIQKLAVVISRPFQDTVIEKGMCFEPHHAVIYYRNGKASYIDMCFGCRGIEVSKNLKITANDFDNQKWDDLVSFFRMQNMTYELD